MTYNVAVPPGPLKVLFLDGTCCVHAVEDASPLLGATKKGDTLMSVNGKPVTPTTMFDVIKAAEYGTSERMLVFQRKSPQVGRKAADDGTSERKLAFRGRVKTTPALPDGPNATGQTRLSMMQPVAGINAAGQMVDADGIGIVMDGGGRVWSAPYAKIMANEVDGCYCSGGLLPLLAASNITSEAEDMYIETGLCFPGVPCLPFSYQFRRVPNTNTFYTQGKQTTPYGAREKDHGCTTQEWSRDTTGQITVINNSPTVCCIHKC